MSSETQTAVLELAHKITHILNNHPIPQEAETACSIARELAVLRSRQAILIPLRVD